MADRTIKLKRGREKLAKSGHPWIFDGALEKGGARPADPCVVQLCDPGGKPLGMGTYNPGSTISIRLFSRESLPLDQEFFTRRFESARELRRRLVLSGDTDSCRLVHGEGDGIPGLVVDGFAGHLVVQVGTPGLAGLSGEWLPALKKVFQPVSVLARPDQGASNRERFDPPAGVLFGDPPDHADIVENGSKFQVSLEGGQKTGFFFDQRENRATIAAMSGGCSVLDAFCYHGGFSVAALWGGASRAVAVDTSADALEAAKKNGDLNGLGDRLETVKSDCHEYLRQGERDFDVVVVDPPALAKKRKDVNRGARAYKDAFMAGLGRVADGGYALLCSCSGSVDRKLFDQIVAGAVADVGRPVRILEKSGAGKDHPVSVAHPEGEYLKVSLLSVG